jgi:hypothetical protein
MRHEVEDTAERAPHGDEAGFATQPDEPSVVAARRRSRALLVVSAVLLLIGVAGLEGLEMIKIRDQRRRARASASTTASATASTKVGERDRPPR